MSVVPVEFLWCSGANTHHDLRSKIKSVTLDPTPYLTAPESLAKDLSVWNFDGSSTGQAKGKDTEILIHPVASFIHPFLPAPAFVVLCECFLPNGQPTPDNTRFKAREVFDKSGDLQPWFGLEQEYVLYANDRPLGWPSHGEPAPQGPYYCSSGKPAYGRKYVDAHYLTCLKIGIKLSGTNAEVMPGQWEYQVGPCEGIQSGDHAVMARWIYLRLLEADGLEINFDSKPKQGDWNGSGMHTNFSTAPMRNSGGLAHIHTAIANLSKNPLREVGLYGNDNNLRLSGHHETSRLDVFNFDVGTRNTSCRIPNQVVADGFGYFEDRRPSASADPWLVTSRLFASSCNIDAPLLEAHAALIEPEWLKALKK